MTELAQRRWAEPTGVRARGTLLVFPGRGETAAAYWRFGARLAADAYRVVVVDPENASTELADAVRPAVVVGSDSGAFDAVAFAAKHDVDAVVVAGVPVGGESDTLVAELASRTACPAHVGVLIEDGTGPRAKSAVAELNALLQPASPAVNVPLLAVHGDADPVSPLADALETYRSWGAAQITTIAGGLHDILSDVTHRTVAATVVIFLERLRLGSELPVIASDLVQEKVR